MWVGLIMASGAISQLSTPIVGAWSDRTGNNRARFLVYGTIMTVIGVSVYFFVSAMESILILFLAQIITTIGLSTQYAMVTALLNDFVREEQTGLGSGAMAILAILGSGLGYALFALDVPVHYSYFSYILLSIFCMGVTVVHIPGGDIEGTLSVLEDGEDVAKRQHGGIAPRAKKKFAPFTVSSLLYESLSMPSISKFPDFFYACLGRALFNAGLGGQVYLVYYLRDIMLTPNPVQVTSILSVLALLGGVVGALPAGILSDKFGKKPLIYASILMCIVSLCLFMLVSNVALIQLVGFVYGIGNVGYLSVDYALGVQVLPKKAVTVEDGAPEDERERAIISVPIDAAKDLGVFAMSATVGQLIGQIIYGTVLDQFSSLNTKGHVTYHTGGFLVIYTISAAAFFVSGISTGCIGISVR